jgi:ribosome biogenesis GTPase
MDNEVFKNADNFSYLCTRNLLIVTKIDPSKNLTQGIILKSTGSWYELRSQTGQIYRARLRGKLKLKDNKMTNPIAVGDSVNYEVENENEKLAIIHQILPRQNYIIRSSTHKTAHGHILAANIDQAVLVATLAMPRTSLGFIDRFLVSAESFRIPTFIVFNKIDLLTDEGLDLLCSLQDLYDNIGYKTLAVSAIEAIGITELEMLIEGKKTLISGHSGVGKSTLLNMVAPEALQHTNEISVFANKGVHTTTFAEMFEVRKDTFVIDTPGIKELGIIGMNEQEIGHYFPEIRAKMNMCKYHNCRHTNEPNCAVREAVAKGEIATSRYQSYLSILSLEDNRK